MTNDSLTPEATLAQFCYGEYVARPANPGEAIKAVRWNGHNIEEVRKVYPGLGVEYMRDKGCAVGDYVVSPSPERVRFWPADTFVANYIPAPSPVASEGAPGAELCVSQEYQCDGVLHDYGVVKIPCPNPILDRLISELTAHNETKRRLEEAEKEIVKLTDESIADFNSTEDQLKELQADRDHYKGLAEKGGAK